jgi:hypothetical protein
MLMFRSTYVVWNFLMKNLIAAMILLKMVLITTLKEESILMNKFNDPLYLPKNSKMHDSNSHFAKFPLIIATIMREEVMSALYMKIIIISCNYLL